MRKEQFLQTLRQNLLHLPANEVNEIIRDQEEFIQDAMSAGRSEEEAVASLGDPRVFASSLSAETKIKQAQRSTELGSQLKQTFGAMFAILALAPLNIIFVMGPFLALVGVLIGGWAAALATLVAGWALLFGFLFKLTGVDVGFWVQLSSFFFLVGSIGIGFLLMIVMYHVTKYFLVGTLAYLKWNMNFVLGKR